MLHEIMSYEPPQWFPQHRLHADRCSLSNQVGQPNESTKSWSLLYTAEGHPCSIALVSWTRSRILATPYGAYRVLWRNHRLRTYLPICLNALRCFDSDISGPSIENVKRITSAGFIQSTLQTLTNLRYQTFGFIPNKLGRTFSLNLL